MQGCQVLWRTNMSSGGLWRTCGPLGHSGGLGASQLAVLFFLATPREDHNVQSVSQSAASSRAFPGGHPGGHPGGLLACFWRTLADWRTFWRTGRLGSPLADLATLTDRDSARMQNTTTMPDASGKVVKSSGGLICPLADFGGLADFLADWQTGGLCLAASGGLLADSWRTSGGQADFWRTLADWGKYKTAGGLVTTPRE
eukprot:gene12375-biopygen3022